MKGQQDAKETEKENVHGDTIDNIKDNLIQTGQRRHNCTYC